VIQQDRVMGILVRVNQLFDLGVPAPRASVLFVIRNHPLTRVATHFRRFAPGLHARPIEAQVPDHFLTSLEEAASRSAQPDQTCFGSDSVTDER
jgi:hypothetical protein